jgi:hypothetical protein
MNNPINVVNGSGPCGGAGTAAIDAIRDCDAKNFPTAGVGVGTPADPIISTHSGSAQLTGAATTTPRAADVELWAPESANAANGDAIIAPTPSANANAPTRPTYPAPLTA